MVAAAHDSWAGTPLGTMVSTAEPGAHVVLHPEERQNAAHTLTASRDMAILLDRAT